MTRLLLALAILFGSPTDADADPGEVTRVRGHLLAARAFVRARDTSHLTEVQRTNRQAALATLDRYIEAGEFPLRTDDSFEGRRPRFIDARGVHCAVGHLIATSGHPDLAHAINRTFEYAYVRDIETPAMHTWADEHGFTVDELARIQPSYSAPPTGDSIEYQIERDKDRFMLACADASAHTRITLVAKGDGHGNVEVSAADSSDRFATCVAALASKLERGGGAFSPSPSAFERTIGLTLRTANQILAERMRDQVGMPRDCTPRPGATPTHATVEITTEDGRIAIHATTSPANAEVNACLEAYIVPRLHAFTFVPDLAWKQRVKLPRMESRAVHDAALRHATMIATDCYQAETTPKQVAITVMAARDDKAFTITTDARSTSFQQCLVEKLEPRLRAAFTVTRERAGEPKQRYFRIDNAIETTVTFTVETPIARDERLTRARKAEKKRIEELVRRRKWENEQRRYDL